MTAYASSSEASAFGRIGVEVHSVNRKGLDIALSLPGSLLWLDVPMRKIISAHVFRGQINVRLTLQTEDFASSQQLVFLRQRKKELETLAGALGYDPKEEISFAYLQEQAGRPLGALGGNKPLETVLTKALLRALGPFLKMKEREGKAICRDLILYISKIEKGIEEIQKHAPSATERYRLKLTELIGNVSNDERLLKEIALFAEKVDIAEEISRLTSHVEEFRRTLKTKGESLGKTLEFIAQEMLRETNTIASKSADIQITNSTISIKSFLEKIREQLQNIE